MYAAVTSRPAFQGPGGSSPDKTALTRIQEAQKLSGSSGSEWESYASILLRIYTAAPGACRTRECGLHSQPMESSCSPASKSCAARTKAASSIHMMLLVGAHEWFSRAGSTQMPRLLLARAQQSTREEQCLNCSWCMSCSHQHARSSHHVQCLRCILATGVHIVM